MSRRDTILIAVLINMGLLASLFISALRPSSLSDLAQEKLSKTPKEMVQKLASQSKNQSIDQIDQILGSYVETHHQKPVEIEPIEIPKQQPETRTEKEHLPKREGREVIVRAGDVLEKIARQHNTSVEEIMRINRLSDSRLQIGQILYLPESSKTEAPKEVVKETSEFKYYVVKNGDSPWSIAIKNNIKLDELLRLNGLDESKAKKLKPGDKLRIR